MNRPIKNRFLYPSFIAIVIFLLCNCSAGNFRTTGELIGAGSASWKEPAPYGMVLVDRGAILAGSNAPDSIWNSRPDARGVSVDAFWMDETEITNAEYRQFVNWVRDSIIRFRLAQPQYGGNEDYLITEDKDGEPISPRINWKKPIPWRTANEDEQRAIESLYKRNPVTGILHIDPEQLIYRYETYDQTESARRRYRTDLRRKNGFASSNDMPMISKDTAYINDNGEIIRKTITRRYTGEFDFVNTYIVHIYPDTTAWINDFNNAYNEPYMRLYFSHGGYNDYPVVGVSWEQANAFCAWRTDCLRRSITTPGIHIEPYRLPTEAEWEYAARAGISKNKYPWNGNSTSSEERGCFYANFKPADGSYATDGFVITSKVGSYKPNAFGLFDMAGNVSEWTSTAYMENINNLTSELNPDLKYNAAEEDPDRLKRKIIRGGSWKDVAHNIRGDIRMWEYQNEQRSYIGFRCVRTHIGFSDGNRRKH